MKYRKLVALLLLLLFVFNSMGYYFLYEMNKVQVYRSFRAYKSSSPRNTITLVQLVDPNFSLELVKAKKEIKLGNQMYDILKVEKRGNQLLFYCVRDNKEERLLYAMGKSVEQLGKLGLLLQFSLYLGVKPTQIYEASLCFLVHYPETSPSLLCNYLPSLSPPPKQVS